MTRSSRHSIFPLELDGAVVHRQAEKLAGVSETERLELYLVLLLGLIERFGATGQGLAASEEKLAKRFVSNDNLPEWADAWETISAARSETFALNLDRGLLILNSWFGLQKLVQERAV